MIKFKLIIINVLVFGNPKPGQGLEAECYPRFDRESEFILQQQRLHQ